MNSSERGLRGSKNTLIPPRRKGGGESAQCCVNLSFVGQSRKLWNFPGRGDDRVNPGGVKTEDLRYSMWPYTGYGLLASLTFANRKGHHSQTCRPKTSQGRVCSLINHFCWVLHNPPNNIYLVACRSTRGVGLLRGTQEHGHCYNLSDILKQSGWQERVNKSNIDTSIRNISLPWSAVERCLFSPLIAYPVYFWSHFCSKEKSKFNMSAHKAYCICMETII